MAISKKKITKITSKEYADGYAETHLEPDVEYFQSYAHIFLMDSLKKDYHVLDIGIGTGGYYLHTNNTRFVTAYDLSKHMLGHAKKFLDEASVQHELINMDFEEAKLDGTFDIIRCGVYGHYLPHNEEIIKKISIHLKEDGFAVFCIQAPTIMESVFLFFRKLQKKNVIKQSLYEFQIMLERCNLMLSLTLSSYKGKSKKSSSIYCFVKKHH